jgi:hypothetical protein
MKRLLCHLLILATAHAGDLATPDALGEALKAALATGDPEKVAALADTAGLTEADRDHHRKSIRELTALGSVFSLAPGDLPPDLPESFVVNGRRFAPSHPPVGVLTVTFRTADGLTSRKIPYTVVDGRHVLVTTRSWRLPWRGPPDRQLKYTLAGPGAEAAEVRVRYSASGLDQDRVFRGDSAGVWGQFFEEISATVRHPKAEVRLTVSEGGSVIFSSDIQRGPGKLVYQKPAAPPEKP